MEESGIRVDSDRLREGIVVCRRDTTINMLYL